MFRSIEIGEEYLKRTYIIPRNKYLNIYYHVFTGSDDDRALHDHPWWSVSFLLSGELREHYESGRMPFRDGWLWWTIFRPITRFRPYFRSPTHLHRMVLKSKKARTLFITGPVVRNWGFRVRHDEGGNKDDWMPHQEFLAMMGE